MGSENDSMQIGYVTESRTRSLVVMRTDWLERQGFFFSPSSLTCIIVPLASNCELYDCPPPPGHDE